MSIIVIEQGRPDGGDFVVGDHKTNGLSIAKDNGQRIIKAVDLGDDYALAGARLEMAWDGEKENLCVLLVVDAGKNSRLVGLQVVPTVIAELGRIKIADLKAGIAAAMDPVSTAEPQ